MVTVGNFEIVLNFLIHAEARYGEDRNEVFVISASGAKSHRQSGPSSTSCLTEENGAACFELVARFSRPLELTAAEDRDRQFRRDPIDGIAHRSVSTEWRFDVARNVPGIPDAANSCGSWRRQGYSL